MVVQWGVNEAALAVDQPADGQTSIETLVEVLAMAGPGWQQGGDSDVRPAEREQGRAHEVIVDGFEVVHCMGNTHEFTHLGFEGGIL